MNTQKLFLSLLNWDTKHKSKHGEKQKYKRMFVITSKMFFIRSKEFSLQLKYQETINSTIVNYWIPQYLNCFR